MTDLKSISRAETEISGDILDQCFPLCQASLVKSDPKILDRWSNTKIKPDHLDEMEGKDWIGVTFGTDWID